MRFKTCAAVNPQAASNFKLPIWVATCALNPLLWRALSGYPEKLPEGRWVRADARFAVHCIEFGFNVNTDISYSSCSLTESPDVLAAFASTDVSCTTLVPRNSFWKDACNLSS